MPEIDDRSAPAPPPWPALSGARKLQHGLFGLLLALPALIWSWGFTVDDALITARVAANLARGLGYRFNPQGAVVDAVTPLGFAYLLAPLARGGTLAAFVAAKWLGALAWLAAALLLGRAIGALGSRPWRWLPLSVLAVSMPCAAWAASGMETGLVTLLATLAVCGRADVPLYAGLAAALRPELLPWALVLGALAPLASGQGAFRVWRGGASVLVPGALVAFLRFRCFGRALPLAFYAKPSDLEHGLRYACGGLAFMGFAWLLLAPLGWRGLSGRGRARLLACAAHTLALTLAGGDWMALYRLWVPLVPTLALVAAELAERAPALASALRGALALAAALLLDVGLGPRARAVGAERAELLAAGREQLAFAQRIATEDAGWVGALGDVEVIDLAGVTDPTVAFFPGGHTSKKIPERWLLARDPDAVVLLLARGAEPEAPYWQSQFSRAVEQHVAATLRDRYRVRASLLFGEQRYLVLERSPTLD